MIRPIDIRLNAAHPELPLSEAFTFTGSPSTVLIRNVPPNCGRWAITAVNVAATFPDGSTTTRAAVQSANGVWVATLPATATSGRTASGLRIMADGIDENGEAVTGYILGVADFAVASLGISPAPEPGETSYQMLYFDTAPSVLRKGDVTKIDGVLKFYDGTAWLPFTDLSNYYTAEQVDEAIDKLAAYYITADAQGNPFATHAALVNAQTYYSGGAARTPTRNDYAVVSADETHGGAEWRYIYAMDAQGVGQWEPQYAVEGVIAYDDAVTRTSANGVKSSGIWGAIWGALAALPTGFSSLYDWCDSQLAGKLGNSQTTIDGLTTLSFIAVNDEPRLRMTGAAGERIDITFTALRFQIPGFQEFVLTLPEKSGTLALLQNLAGDFDATRTAQTKYVQNELTVYNNVLYRCTNANGHYGAWVAADFAVATVEDILAALRAAIPAPYSLPTASANTLGGIKVGQNLTIDENGVLNASGGGGGGGGLQPNLVTFFLEPASNRTPGQGFKVNGTSYTAGMLLHNDEDPNPGMPLVFTLSDVTSFEVLWGGYRGESGDVYVNGQSIGKPTSPVAVTGNNTYVICRFGSCLSPDTSIAMADGSVKRLDEVKVGDMVRSIDPETGELSSDRVTEVSHGVGKFRDVWTFKDGHTVTTVGRHRFWNADLGEFMYLEAWNDGESARNADGKRIKLTNRVHEEGKFPHATLFTERWNNYFAGGLLAGNRRSTKGRM